MSILDEDVAELTYARVPLDDSRREMLSRSISSASAIRARVAAAVATLTQIETDEALLEANPQDLICVSWATASDSRWELANALNSRYPASVVHTTRIIGLDGAPVEQTRHTDNLLLFDEEFFPDPPLDRGNRIKKLVEAAKSAPDKRVRWGHPGFTYSKDSLDLIETRHWDYNLGRYLRQPGELTEAGCIVEATKVPANDLKGWYHDRHSDPFVVYAPEKAAKLLLRIEKSNLKARDKKSRRKKKGLLVREVAEPVYAMHKIRNDDPDHGWYESTTSYLGSVRWSTVNGFGKIVWLFNTIYGRNAHRQVKQFQELLEKWRDKEVRAATKAAWGDEFKKFFAWLDAEAKLKKPRKRKLKARSSPKLW